MRAYLATAPVWVTALIQGVVFTVVETLWAALQYHDFGLRLLVLNLALGAVFTVGMGLVGRRQRRRFDYALGDLSTDQRRAAFRAASTGSPPDDPALRGAAAAVVAEWSDELDRTKVLVLAVAALLGISSLAFAATNTPWWLLGAASCLAMIAWTVRYPVVLRRRLIALESSGSATPAANP